MPFFIAFLVFASLIAVASVIASASTLGTPFPGVWLRRGDGAGRGEGNAANAKPAHATK
jgi:hypothetical protein